MWFRSAIIRASVPEYGVLPPLFEIACAKIIDCNAQVCCHQLRYQSCMAWSHAGCTTMKVSGMQQAPHSEELIRKE